MPMQYQGFFVENSPSAVKTIKPLLFVRDLPSAINTKRPGDGSCRCAIHVPVECDVVGALGCRSWKPGTHKSIAVLYDSEKYNTYCHVEDGQAFLDYYFACMLASVDGYNEYGISSKYMQGSSVAVVVYGAGYCYLQLFAPEIRNRIARTLGPLPMVIDVVRALMVVGPKVVKSFLLTEVSDNVYHVVVQRGSVWIEPRIAMSMLLCSTRDIRTARVGATNDQLKSFLHQVYAGDVRAEHDTINSVVVVQRVSGFAGLFGMTVNTLTNYQVDSLIDMSRLNTLRDWFEKDCDCRLSDELNIDLYFATTALANIPLSVGGLKERIRMWAILGDSVIKVFQSSYCCGVGSSPGQYTDLSLFASNKNLARNLKLSGLRDCCNVFGLSIESEGNATILEAVIGVLALRSDHLMLKNVIVHKLNLVPELTDLHFVKIDSGFQPWYGTYIVPDDCATPSDQIGLTSLELARAMALKRSGLL